MFAHWVYLKEFSTKVIVQAVRRRMAENREPRGARAPAGDQNRREEASQETSGQMRSQTSASSNAPAGAGRESTPRRSMDNIGLRESFLEMRNAFAGIQPLLQDAASNVGQSTALAAIGAARSKTGASASAGRCLTGAGITRMSSIIAHAKVLEKLRFFFISRA